MLHLDILDIEMAERADDVVDHALVAILGLAGARLLIDERLPADRGVLDRLAVGLRGLRSGLASASALALASASALAVDARCAGLTGCCPRATASRASSCSFRACLRLKVEMPEKGQNFKTFKDFAGGSGGSRTTKNNRE
jgi:hypothetical protein